MCEQVCGCPGDNFQKPFLSYHMEPGPQTQVFGLCLIKALLKLP